MSESKYQYLADGAPPIILWRTGDGIKAEFRMLNGDGEWHLCVGSWSDFCESKKRFPCDEHGKRLDHVPDAGKKVDDRPLAVGDWVECVDFTNTNGLLNREWPQQVTFADSNGVSFNRGAINGEWKGIRFRRVPAPVEKPATSHEPIYWRYKCDKEHSDFYADYKLIGGLIFAATPGGQWNVSDHHTKQTLDSQLYLERCNADGTAINDPEVEPVSDDPGEGSPQPDKTPIPCEACGTPWSDHLGSTAQCRELSQWRERAIKAEADHIEAFNMLSAIATALFSWNGRNEVTTNAMLREILRLKGLERKTAP